MGKDAYYFSHDANAQDDEKILDLRADYGWEGYGLFWAILELMRNQSDYMLENGNRLYKKLSMKFNVRPDFMEQFFNDCLEYGLFIEENGKIYSKSFLERMEKYEKRKSAARKAANARWNNDSGSSEKQKESKGNANVMRTHSDGNASKVKESKEKKNGNKPSDKSDQAGDKFSINKLDNGRYDYPEEFEIIWSAYPESKSNKKAGWRKWTALRRKGVGNDQLLLTVSNYFKEIKKNNTDVEYTKHMKTFFGPDDYWKDYLDNEFNQHKENGEDDKQQRLEKQFERAKRYG